MLDDGDRILTLVGIGLVTLVLAGIGVSILAATTGPTGAEPPNAEWRLDRVNDSFIQITHAGGDPVPAEELIVTVEGYERSVTWSGQVADGDSTIVRATENNAVHLYWKGGRGDQVSLGVWRV